MHVICKAPTACVETHARVKSRAANRHTFASERQILTASQKLQSELSDLSHGDWTGKSGLLRCACCRMGASQSSHLRKADYWLLAARLALRFAPQQVTSKRRGASPSRTGPQG